MWGYLPVMIEFLLGLHFAVGYLMMKTHSNSLPLISFNGIVPPTINHQTADDQLDPKINFTLGQPQKRTVDVALSNTFGFGGHNACVIFKKIS